MSSAFGKGPDPGRVLLGRAASRLIGRPVRLSRLGHKADLRFAVTIRRLGELEGTFARIERGANSAQSAWSSAILDVEPDYSAPSWIDHVERSVASTRAIIHKIRYHVVGIDPTREAVSTEANDVTSLFSVIDRFAEVGRELDAVIETAQRNLRDDPMRQRAQEYALAHALRESHVTGSEAINIADTTMHALVGWRLLSEYSELPQFNPDFLRMHTASTVRMAFAHAGRLLHMRTMMQPGSVTTEVMGGAVNVVTAELQASMNNGKDRGLND